ncbi:MAG: type II toxin-antitoxin system RelB/DinJ family antitoxin [Bacteroidaceae bacterium]|nr:type II toxin-antitoxin system RelB/DinJ family antitoxin [Bacteroidaceae bacterium]
MDANLKSSFDALCSQFGMSANAAMNVFARAVVQRGRIPFDVMSDEVAARTQESIDKFWAEKQWGVNEINSLLDEHLRTPYKPDK